MEFTREQKIIKLIVEFDDDCKLLTCDLFRIDNAKTIYNKSPILNAVWKEAQKELLEEVRKDLKNVQMININKYIDKKLKEFGSQ